MSQRKKQALKVFRATLAVLVAGAVVYAIWTNWDEVSAYLRELSFAAVLASGALALVPPILTMLGWRVLLADLGSPLHVAPAAGIFFVGQLGKYLPGSVWTVLAQAEIGARLDIPRRRTAVAGLISVGMAVIAGIIVGLPVLPLMLARDDTFSAFWSIILVLPFLVIILRPRLLNALVGWGLRLLRRSPLEHNLSGRAVRVTTAWLIATWLVAGLQVWVLAHSVGAAVVDEPRLVVVSISGFALAASAGMLSVFLPAGVGVRDGLVILLLGTVMPLGAATAVAVLARFLATFADVVWAVAGWLWARSHNLVATRRERSRGGVPVDDEAGP